jgi:hypothetical protein
MNTVKKFPVSYTLLGVFIPALEYQVSNKDISERHIIKILRSIAFGRTGVRIVTLISAVLARFSWVSFAFE